MLHRSAVRHSPHGPLLVRGLQLLAREFLACPFAALAPPAASAAGGGSESTSSPPSGTAARTTLDAATIQALSRLDKGADTTGTSSARRVPLETKQVPSSRAGRAMVFGSLALRLGWDKLTNPNPKGTMISREGHEQIASTLCRMRGALLKLGQMLSIQDDKTVPAVVTQVFERVRDSAYAMPRPQLEEVMREAYGSRWKPLLTKEEASAALKDNPNSTGATTGSGAGDADGSGVFLAFDMDPLAAASIGQVHRAVVVQPRRRRPAASTDGTVKEEETEDAVEEMEVAVKVQYPGVAASINSDVANLSMLISFNFLPKGLFVGNILNELKAELTQECQYLVEAGKQERYADLLASDPALSSVFAVPKVLNALCRKNVLVTEFVRGINIDLVAKMSSSSSSSASVHATTANGKGGNDGGGGPASPIASGSPATAAAAGILPAAAAAVDIPQAYKNHLAHHMMLLTLTELFVWHFMQTDPNFSNFLFDAKAGKINLIDFGAARAYDTAFIHDYLDVVAAAAQEDRPTIIAKSINLGFLTGQESKEMLDAHCSSVIILGKPFRKPPQSQVDQHAPSALFDFSREHLPSQIQAHVPTMLRLRLRPPPTPIYSLHRRLSGTILLCTKLNASIGSPDMFWTIYDAAQRSKPRL